MLKSITKKFRKLKHKLFFISDIDDAKMNPPM